MRLIRLIGIIVFLLIIDNLKVGGQIQKSQKQVFWLEVEEWSACSTTCGAGTQQKKVICMEKSLYSEEMISDEKCKTIPSLSPSIRECNVGDCNSNYIWRPGKWSECSQTCGSNGRTTRDIECVYDEGSGNLVTSESKFCDQSLRPDASSLCNILDCPLKFVAGEWGKCITGRKCMPGTQRRPMACISILKNGKLKSMPRHACSATSKPLISWRKCNDHFNDKECLKNISVSPIIETKKNTLVQMRKTKLLNIGVGQLAYVYLYTRIMINCPVTYFVPRDVVWKHGDTIYKYQGKSKDNIRVDRKGRLRIRKLELKDQGTWTCIAGTKNASTIMKVRNPAVGFQDWKLRTTLSNKEMLNEDPESGMARSEVIQWIKKGWSPCSVTCGSQGFQSREVHCEKSDKQHYTILDDSICEKRGQKKPLSRRSCQMATQCPKWILLELKPNKCTNKCVRIGIAQLEGKLQCIHQDREMDFSACNKKEKPDIDCSNDQCQVDWKKSNWSKCSKSCGGVGIMARYLICIWKNTGDPAGSLCYNQKIPVPEVIKSCTAPKCNLKCVDLSPYCKPRMKRCRSSIYRYTCCKTCSSLDVYSKMQGDDSSKNEKNSLINEISKKSNLEIKKDATKIKKSFKNKPLNKEFSKKVKVLKEIKRKNKKSTNENKKFLNRKSKKRYINYQQFKNSIKDSVTFNNKTISFLVTQNISMSTNSPKRF